MSENVRSEERPAAQPNRRAAKARRPYGYIDPDNPLMTKGAFSWVPWRIGRPARDARRAMASWENSPVPPPGRIEEPDYLRDEQGQAVSPVQQVMEEQPAQPPLGEPPQISPPPGPAGYPQPDARFGIQPYPPPAPVYEPGWQPSDARPWPPAPVTPAPYPPGYGPEQYPPDSPYGPGPGPGGYPGREPTVTVWSDTAGGYIQVPVRDLVGSQPASPVPPSSGYPGGTGGEPPGWGRPIERDRPLPNIDSALYSPRIGGAWSQGDLTSRYEQHVAGGGNRDFFVGVYDGYRDPQGRDIIVQQLDQAVRANIQRGAEPHMALKEAYKRLLPTPPLHLRGLNTVNAIRQGDMLYVTTLGNGKTKAVLNRDGKPHREGDLSRPSDPTHPTLWIQEINIVPEDKQLILASEGLWEVMSPADAITFIKNYGDPEEASKRLTDEALRIYRARNRGTQIPNITALVINLQHDVRFPRETPPTRPDAAVALAIPMAELDDQQRPFVEDYLRRIRGIDPDAGPDSPTSMAVIEYPRDPRVMATLLQELNIDPTIANDVIRRMQELLTSNEPFAIDFRRDQTAPGGFTVEVISASETAGSVQHGLNAGLESWLPKENEALLTAILSQIRLRNGDPLFADAAAIRTKLDEIARDRAANPGGVIFITPRGDTVDVTYRLPEQTAPPET